MELDSASKVELIVVLVGIVGLCRSLYIIISRDRENARRYGRPPGRATLGKRLQIALNPSRLHRGTWTPARATVKQTFLVRRDIWATATSDPLLATHSWKIAKRYRVGFRYKYTVANATYWGEHRPAVIYRHFLGEISYKTEKEARERADSLLEAQISIRYDPDLPEDSQPVFDTGWPLHD